MAATDFFALLGINVVLCALAAKAMHRWPRPQRLSYGPAAALALLTVVLWWPRGGSDLPWLAYVRGISSDFSVVSISLALGAVWACFSGASVAPRRELSALYALVTVAALVLYPTALGWGNWDAYRLGWGTPGLVLAVIACASVCFMNGLRVVPGLIAAAVVAWTAGLLESNNLWDYLIDPWLSVLAFCRTLATAWSQARSRFGRGDAM